jgi:N-acetylmuramic acid 6-phosphate (MurNAc-6-P) etherase
VALVMLKNGIEAQAARVRLALANENLRQALGE